jgi:hypothetical protein
MGSFNNTVQIFQFKAQYRLSDISDDIRIRMTRAVANLLQVSILNVILSFASMTARILQQQESVLVSVGLVNLQGSTVALISMLSQKSINLHMAAEGLNSVEIFIKALETSTSPGI